MLTWLFYRLAREPRAAAALQAEARTAPFASGDAPSLAQLEASPYALNVCREALRLYPGGFTIGRRAVRAFTVGEFEIDAGAWVIVSPFSVQRSTAAFADPLAFIPERFDNDAQRNWPRGAYIPFGLGPRTCIGGQFALMETHTVVAALARALQFTDETVGDAQVRPMIALSPDRTITMRVRRLHKKNRGSE